MQARRYFVIGDPIGHSLSPAMHGAAMRALGLPHTYETMRVAADELPSTLDRVRRGSIAGLNVTVPHKVAVLALLDAKTDECAATGAANTVWLDPTGRLVGANTDVHGFIADVRANEIRPRSVLVLGAGGAARAVVVACSSLGDPNRGGSSVDVSVAARRDEEAQRLVRELGRGRAVGWNALEGSVPFDVVVNTTSAGMLGGPPGERIAEAWSRASVSRDAVAYDLVYRPHAGATTTPFLHRAVTSGHRAVSGLGMLVEQGARALSLFLDRPIPDDVRRAMRRAVEDALAPSNP